MAATRPYLPYILLAFHFDNTLGSNSTEAILEVQGVPRSEYEQDFVDLWERSGTTLSGADKR